MNHACAHTSDVEPWLAGELDAAATRRLDLHLSACEPCSQELAWLKAERRLVAQHRATSPAPAAHLWTRVLERLSEEPAARPGWALLRLGWPQLLGGVLCAGLFLAPVLCGPRARLERLPAVELGAIAMCPLDPTPTAGANDERGTCDLNLSLR